MSSQSFLFLPSVRQGNGTGHLQRSLRIAEQMGSDRKNETRIYIFIPGIEQRPDLKHFMETKESEAYRVISDERELLTTRRDFTIWDRRETSLDEITRWRQLGTPIGIDEGGEARPYFPFLLDMFPLPPEYGEANISEAGFLPQPANRRNPPEQFQRVLVSFGGEDPGHLTEILVQWFLEKGGYAPEQLTVVIGPFFGERSLPGGVAALQSPDNLAEVLAEYDLVCTSFGLTAYEAAAAGTGVLLLNPSQYHSSLARLAGFTEIGTNKVDNGRMKRCLQDPAAHIPILKKIVPFEAMNPAEFLLKMAVPVISGCPVCGREEATALFREEDRSFFSCSQCGTLYQMDFAVRDESYTREYFFSEYRKQYGRTYLDDFDKIRRLGRSRLGHINKIMRKRPVRIDAIDQPPQLLDVGCAYGPFLKEAAEAGFEVTGIDPVESAVAYVRGTLGFSAFSGSFESYESDPELFDVITMWYVVEHFADTDLILRKAAGLLKPGGVLALSTPNLKGISGRGDFREFLRRSPRDHHIIWSPKVAGKVLQRYGLTARKTVITGHHPERFPGLKSLGNAHHGIRRSMVKTMGKTASRIARLGDTFEIYAQKTGDSNG